jgi:hypothetical protein
MSRKNRQQGVELNHAKGEAATKQWFINKVAEELNCKSTDVRRKEYFKEFNEPVFVTGNYEFYLKSEYPKLKKAVQQKLAKRQIGPEELKPSGVKEETWKDFIQQRKEKNKPLTKTAVDCLIKEAEKAGWSVQDALEKALYHGWQSFQAHYVQNKNDKHITANLDHLKLARQLGEAQKQVQSLHEEIKFLRQERTEILLRIEQIEKAQNKTEDIEDWVLQLVEILDKNASNSSEIGQKARQIMEDLRT